MLLEEMSITGMNQYGHVCHHIICTDPPVHITHLSLSLSLIIMFAKQQEVSTHTHPPKCSLNGLYT